MPRNMSFAMTLEQFQAGTKDVTRRLGWKFLNQGDTIWGVEKAMGLQKGEKIQRLGLIKIVSAREESIDAITQEDVIREGFPEMTPQDFVSMFCKHHQATPDTLCNRIEFKHIELYRPSNGTEGDCFFSEFCHKCRKHCDSRPCQILNRSLCYDTTEPEYPWQWQRDPDEGITCKAFSERNRPYRPRSQHQRCNKTLDMFPHLLVPNCIR